jgi:RNA polymerase sigma factor FliA
MQLNADSDEILTYKQVPSSAQLDVGMLISKHSPLVRRIAWHVHSRMSTAIEIEDLMQIGMIALVEASRTFEDRGIAFAPYASMRIRGAMIDELRRDARMSRAGMVNRRTLAATRARLENEHGRHVAESEMATALELDMAAYHNMVASTQALRQESIDEVYSDRDIGFADITDNAEGLFEKSQMREALSENIAKLEQREAMVLQLYFLEELNLDEIGEALNVGAARVCQIKKAALEKLRGMMHQYLAETLDAI